VKSEILKLVDLRHDLTDGRCGLPLVDLKNELGIEYNSPNDNTNNANHDLQSDYK